MQKLKYLEHYPQTLQQQVHLLIENDGLKEYLLNKYPKPHGIKNDKSLFNYALEIKNQYIKKSAPLTKS